VVVLILGDSTQQRGTASSIVESPSILSRLRLETRCEHDAVEQVLDLMNPLLTRDSYCRHLQRFYGFYAPLEAVLQAQILGKRNANRAGELTWSHATCSALGRRLTKAALLRQDLQHLGITPKDLPFCRDLPLLETQAEMLGCLYVVEGATLGGRIITRHVRATLGITPATGGSFFEGYGDDTGTMWQAMRHLLVSGSPDVTTENTIVANAIATFACLRCWCQSNQ
jgi:heme oxygenase (biliverdin-IX-beta and delta-forming)